MKSQLWLWMGCASLAFATLSARGLAAEMERKGTLPAEEMEKKDYPNAAKIDLQSAVSAALKKVPGKAVEAELESEDGYLVYEVKIATADKRLAEVKVDAGNGSVLGVEVEKEKNLSD